MNQDHPHLDQILAAFAELYVLERAEGRERPLAAYLERFPDHQEEVAREYLLLRGEGALPGAGEASVATPQDQVGTYRLIEEIGRGGQAVVWRAEDTRLGRMVAVKLLHHLDGDPTRALERFRREAALTSRLDDPGICAIYEIGFEGTPWIAMRFVEGESLAARIRRAWSGSEESAVTLEQGPGSSAGEAPSTVAETGVEASIRLIAQVARSLHVAHEAGVVHRDIKPPNIMVTETERPVILDFGIAATSEDGTPTLTRSGEVVGTPAYMAPEQISAALGPVDRRTDVYALGATLYECVTGHRPHDGATREALYRAILEEPITDPRRHAPAIGPDLAAVTMGALARVPSDRYRTAEALADDLDRVLKREPVRVRPPSALLKLRRWSERNPTLAAASVSLFVLLAVALMVSLRLLDTERKRAQSERERNTAVTERAAVLQEEARAAAHRRKLNEPSVLQALLDEADELWPRRLSKAPAMDRWLARADEALRDRAERSAELERMRARALPLEARDEPAQEAIRRAEHPEYYRALDAADAAIAAWEEELKSAELPVARRRLLRRNVSGTRANLTRARKDARVTARVVWRFEAGDDQELHDALAATTARHGELELRRGEVARRREVAELIHAESREKASEAWQRCIREVQASGIMDGRVFEPQEGLVPLGRDASSGCWEFFAVESGDRPVWKGEFLSGRVEPSSSMGVVFVLIPAGTPWIGAQRTAPKAPRHDPLAMNDERPPTRVTLDAFFLSKYEATQHQWNGVMSFNPSHVSLGKQPSQVDGRLPIEGISHEEATEFARRLDLVLPTEEQWEYAAAGGVDTTTYWSGPTPSSLRGKENGANGGPIGTDQHRFSAPVGSYAANGFGLFDVCGNVNEWTRSRWGPYDNPPRRGDGFRAVPPQIGGSQNFVWRGGGFTTATASGIRISNRAYSLPRAASWLLGVRLARPVR